MADNRWWLTVYTPGVRQRTDPGGDGYKTANIVLTPEEKAAQCDRYLSPAIITSERAFKGDRLLSKAGTYEGPGYYLLDENGVAHRIWAPGDETQRPGEDYFPWQYRIGAYRP